MNLSFKLDDPKHTFVIAEAGSNWKCGSFEEDLQRAKELITVAAKAGADAVKFQTYRPETVYASNPGKSDYLSKQGIKENIDEIFKHLSMPYEMIPQLSEYCRNQNILFMSTPFSVNDAKQIDSYVKIHKVASYEINHVRLLEFLAETNKPILISTGASTLTEIDFAVNLIQNKNKKGIGIMQCTATYPAPLEALNLSVIPNLKSRFNLPIGLSDHSMDPVIAPLVAIGLGATIIEKHFTLDRTLPGPDHPFALEPKEFEKMVESIRKADLTKGTGIKEILKEEQELSQYAKRSIQAIRKISKGEILQEGINIEVLRPGNQKRGTEARFLEEIIGKRATRDILLGEGITEYE